MASVYIIDNTAGDNSITIRPGALNGPGGTNRNSDLRLYGMGALQWGEGVDENIYRLAESFACPKKQLGDFLPGGVAGNSDYDPAVHPIMPKDENDLGPGKGITVPLKGQLWFNTDSQSLYVYTDPDGWRATNAARAQTDPPLSPQVGDIWYDTDGGDDNGCITDPIIKVYDPSHSEAPADGWVVVGENFIRQCGDWMSGVLDMGGSAGNTPNNIINVADPVNPLDAVNYQTVTAIDNILTAHTGDYNLHLTSNQNTFLDNLNLPTLTSNEVNQMIGINTNQNVQDQIDGKVALAGDTMTGFLTLNADPVNSLHAATKNYVDDAIGQADQYLERDPTAPDTGDVKAVGATLQMYLGGIGWVQIWPAQYTA